MVLMSHCSLDLSGVHVKLGLMRDFFSTASVKNLDFIEPSSELYMHLCMSICLCSVSQSLFL